MSNIDKWFGPVASLIIVTAIGSLAIYMGQQVRVGIFPWWPYPAFVLLLVIIFTAYKLLIRE